ncbi:hypothetical protein JS532_08180 [Bifidobacterium callimiconis]|uniref:hypothetical protein n=1 Tax=Bifidobacterium callimiconis TaxID=2306973 RepID=UPI001BDCD532|nr:hypothetical protein [Bifidobacterium callimiconis]MBT1177536.1 hypothetical protein [Bifidobacterium callimiconis]
MADIHNASGQRSVRSDRRGDGLRSMTMEAGPFVRRVAAIAVAMAMTMMVCVWSLSPLGAQPVAAAERTGTLTISATVASTDGGSAHVLVGDTYAVAHVADATLGDNGAINGFTTRDAFASLGRDWGTLSSSEYNDAAKELADYAAAHGLYDVTDHAVTGTDGRAVVRGLTPGLYLVSRTGVDDANAGYVCDAFLVAIPENSGDGSGDGDGAVNYNVVASPKFEQTTTPGPGPSEQPTPKPSPTPTSTTPAVSGGQSNIAKTGAAIMRYVQAAVILGGIALLFLFIRSRRNRANSDSGLR